MTIRVDYLMEMGFPHELILDAPHACASTEAAVDWLLRRAVELGGTSYSTTAVTSSTGSSSSDTSSSSACAGDSHSDRSFGNLSLSGGPGCRCGRSSGFAPSSPSSPSSSGCSSSLSWSTGQCSHARPPTSNSACTASQAAALSVSFAAAAATLAKAAVVAAADASQGDTSLPLHVLRSGMPDLEPDASVADAGDSTVPTGAPEAAAAIMVAATAAWSKLGKRRHEDMTTAMVESAPVKRQCVARLLEDGGRAGPADVSPPGADAVHLLPSTTTPTSPPRPCQGDVNGGVGILSSTATCAICVEETFGAVTLPCGHGSYCMTCLRRYAEARLDVGSPIVPCPECTEALSQAALRVILPPLTFERLLDRSLQQAVSSSSDMWPCPTPNCTNCVALEGPCARFSCDLCGMEHCLWCHASPYHEGLSCEQNRAKRAHDAAEKSLQEWMESTGSKQCPTCRMGITKQDLGQQETQRSECHKMICRNCGTRFCFQCLAVLHTGYTCGCTSDNHGFIDPDSGAFLPHLVAPGSRDRCVTRRRFGRWPPQ